MHVNKQPFVAATLLPAGFVGCPPCTLIQTSSDSFEALQRRISSSEDKDEDYFPNSVGRHEIFSSRINLS